MFKSLSIAAIFLMQMHVVFGQDLEMLNKKEAVKVSGGLNFNSTAFASDREGSYRDPFAWYASGNINITALGMSFPFSYSLSNQGRSMSQPSNIVSISPSYKWFKSYIGRTSMNFSSYTMSGVTFSGAGVDLSPKNLRIKAMFGQFAKAVEYDMMENNLNYVAFERWGGAFQFGFNIKKINIDWITMKAGDVLSSLNFIPGQATITAKDNLVTSLKVKAPVFNKLTLDIESAGSFLTNNLRSDEMILDNRWHSMFYPLVRGNGTTSFYKAVKGSLNYSFKLGGLAFNYERVDPGYLTLGGLFFNNDLENYTIAPSLSLFNNKLNLAINTGVQKNNLANDKASQTERWVGSVNMSTKIAKKVNLSTSYSNFSAFTRNNPLVDPFTNQMTYLDTFNVYQISQNMTTSLNYGFGETNKSNISTSFTYQNSQNITGELANAGVFGINATGTSIPAKTYVSTLSYSYSISESKMAVTLSGNANYSDLSMMNTLYLGPSLNVRKSFGKEKPSISGGITYNRNFQNEMLTNNIFNYRFSIAYSPKLINEKYGAFSFSLNSMYLNKLPTQTGEKTINELTIVANASYTFK